MIGIREVMWWDLGKHSFLLGAQCYYILESLIEVIDVGLVVEMEALYEK